MHCTVHTLHSYTVSIILLLTTGLHILIKMVARLNHAGNLQHGFDSGSGHNAFLLSSRTGKTYIYGCYTQRRNGESKDCDVIADRVEMAGLNSARPKKFGTLLIQPLTIGTLYENDSCKFRWRKSVLMVIIQHTVQYSISYKALLKKVFRFRPSYLYLSYCMRHE
jgi:hypothetical protein